MLSKIKWFLCAIFLAPFFKSIKFPTYIAMPLFSLGLNKVVIGKKVRIFPGLRIEVHNKGNVVIEDNVGIAQNVHITSAGNLTIGEGTVVNANVFITNIDHDYSNIEQPVSEQGFIIKDTTIGRNCFIGIGAAIQAGTTLGDHCIIGANAVVRGRFPDYSVIVGVPAVVVKRYDAEVKDWVRVERNNGKG